MSRDSSPPALSDDSAVGSMSSSVTHRVNTTNQDGLTTQHQQPPQQQLQQLNQPSNSQQDRAQVLKPKCGPAKINSDDLALAAKQMRRNNVGLISRSIRTNLTCFDELDTRKFETNGDFFVNFVSNGIYKCSTSTILKPVSILWPHTYDKIVEQLGILDAFLLNTLFHVKPVEWMLKRGLTTVPTCRLCKDKMTLDYHDNLVRWHCKKSQACLNYYMPIQRPSFFNGFEQVGLKKLLFAVYFWSTCTPGEDLSAQLNIDLKLLNGLWKRLQNVCRTALEKSYPRHRLTDCIDGPEADPSRPADQNDTIRVPIDLISIKLNRVFVVCAKHPSSNLVRLGLYIPNVSQYSFADLTESWFAHGASVRISESKFLELTQKRTDLKLQLVDRSKIIAKEGRFDRTSAFGYLVTQLTHVFKDYDSSSLPIESLKLMLAEMQWRELYGTTPFDAFTNIVNHMAQYCETSDWYSEVSLPVLGEETLQEPELQTCNTLNCTKNTWAEKYYYATVEPIDSEGNIISRKKENLNFENLPPPNARVTCHICYRKFECFDFSLHLMTHIEANRKEYERKEYQAKSLIECKHCFKIYRRDHIIIHSTLLRTFLHNVRYGCRICCIKLDDRDQFLQHMRRKHFEHETPYHCPSCKYASSFQRDVFIHFSEEHRHNLIILCTLCLRSFTVAKPEVMTNDKMRNLSKIVYNHIAEHYVLSKSYTCTNCCLCFLNDESLKSHQRLHHNPCEIRSDDQVALEPFILDRNEEKYCIKALPAELFIANKRPNLTLDKKRVRRGSQSGRRCDTENSLSSSGSSDEEEPNNNNVEPQTINQCLASTSSDIPTISETVDNHMSLDPPAESISKVGSTSDEETDSVREDGLIHVRGLSKAHKFLAGGVAAMTIPKSRASVKSHLVTSDKPGDCSSQRLIEYLSRMKRADGIIPNQSVVLAPSGKPAKCSECGQFITVDHYVSPINCSPCKYLTLCPRAATKHYKDRHGGEN